MMPYKNKYLFLQTPGRILLSLLLTTLPIKAEERFGFEALTAEDGLLSSFVYSVAEDHDGFMWIGGANGLQRFDGNEFRTFLHISEDKTSLSNNVINCLLVGHNGDVWVGTNNGLNLYVQDQEKFQLIQLNARTENFFDINKIKTLLQTDNGVIWIGTAFGLSRYDIEQQQATHYKHPEISVIQPLDAHNLIIGTRNAGLYKFNTLDATFTALNNTAIDLSTTGIRDISKQPRDQYLIATWGKGVLSYHSQTETISMTDFNLPDLYILQILSDGTGSYWLASSTGLHRLNDQKAKSKYHIQLEIDDTDNDAEKRIRSLYQSKDGNLWITTSGYGLFRYYIDSNQFEYYVPNKMDETGLQDKVVIDFSESSDGRIYLAKLSGNIAIFDKDKKTFQHLSFLKHGKPFKKIINAIAALSSEELLISSGQETFRARTDLPVQEITTSKQYPLLKQMALIKTNQTINPPVILSATSQQLHFLNINPAGDIYIQNSFPYRSSRMVSYFVTPWQDVYAADEEGEVIKIENYKAPSPNIAIIRKRDNFYIDSIAVDNNKNLWIANEGSKIIVQPENKPAFFYDIQRENATGFGALQYLPTSNQLWLTTTQGLSSINLNDDAINHYDELDGLQKKLDETGATLAAKDGSLYFGGRHGFNRFFAEQINPNLKDIRVKLIDFFLSGNSVKPLARKESILRRSILNTDLIILNHHQNSFGFEFSAVLAPYKKNITYAYKLTGYEDNWHYVSSKKRFATYTNIPPGNYAFTVKAKNKNHIWSTQNASVKISITPPWWKTSFAYTCYAIMMALCIYLIVKWRTATLLTRQRLLEQSVIQRTTELAIEKNKVEQLLVKKDEEFANISHEFRTPLTLILGFIRQIIANHKQPAKLEQLHIIQNNGSRLLRMVNQLLDIEAFKVKSVSTKIVQDFAATITTLVTAFTPIAQDKNITLKMPTLEKILFEFTVDAFEQIMLNLLSNAIKYTQAGGSITISSMRTPANELKIIVSDTGMGIPQEQQQAIFARFNRIHNARNDHIVGTGIGLALVKSLVEAHQGKITVDSIVNQGTSFILHFPIINEALINFTSLMQTNINDELIAREIKSITVSASRPKNVAPILTDSKSNQSTLLLIDDNPDMLDYLSLILQDDYQIICANNGPYALESAYQEIPDLIISDVMMPDIDGYELVSALRENVMTDHIPIILLTAKSDSESKLKGFNKQADEYLTKPFDENELKIRIKNLLDIREILKKHFSALPSGHNGFQASKNYNNGNNENKFLLSLDIAIESMYMDMELRISQIADHLKISERQLFRKLKNTADMNPTEYLRNFRLQKAAEQLNQGIKPTVVAFNVGFSSASYFNKCFKAQYKLTPSEFQKRDYMHTS